MINLAFPLNILNLLRQTNINVNVNSTIKYASNNLHALKELKKRKWTTIFVMNFFFRFSSHKLKNIFRDNKKDKDILLDFFLVKVKYIISFLTFNCKSF